MFLHSGHQVIYPAKEIYDKMFCIHGVLLPALASTPKA
jgi:hypothetical protein